MVDRITTNNIYQTISICGHLAPSQTQRARKLRDRYTKLRWFLCNVFNDIFEVDDPYENETDIPVLGQKQQGKQSLETISIALGIYGVFQKI